MSAIFAATATTQDATDEHPHEPPPDSNAHTRPFPRGDAREPLRGGADGAAGRRVSFLGVRARLAFRGSRKLDFRDERGMYVGLPDKVNELFDEYSIRFQR